MFKPCSYEQQLARIRMSMQKTKQHRYDPTVQQLTFTCRELHLLRYRILSTLICTTLTTFNSGYVEHPPNSDRFEVRNPITVEFLGTPQGTLLVHLFQDGTIKTREEMNAENNQRVAEDQRLSAEKISFPNLGKRLCAGRRKRQ